MVDENNHPIFGPTYSSSFFNLANGDEYPCGNNQPAVTFTKSHKCYIFYGDPDFMGSHVQIIMTDLTQSASQVINARLLLRNPSIVGQWLSVKVKAYGGGRDERSLYGSQALGFWNFDNVYQISAEAGSQLSITPVYSYLTNNKQYPWRPQTIWSLSPSIRWVGTMNTGDYIIM